MPIDFQSEENRRSYSGRAFDPAWADLMRAIVDPSGRSVADIGCGGGIYSRAWEALGAARVVGVDFSRAQLAEARRRTDSPRVSYQHGTALATGLPDASADVVFERALLHHGIDRTAALQEARRVLTAGGVAIVQDRTMGDVATPAAPDHLRGYFLERFPRLLEVERARRPAGNEIETALRGAGFQDVRTSRLFEVRRRYTTFDELAADLRARAGRSILHELSDAELDDLIVYLRARLPAQDIVDRDRWTVWSGWKRG